MSIVEKAAERLKALQPDAQTPAHDELAPPQDELTPRHDGAASAHSAPTIERLQRRAPTADPVPEAVPACHVDRKALERAGLLPVGDEANSRLADELRRIKRPLIENTLGKGSKLLARAARIMVASAMPGEGKTFTALNLAMSLAREVDFEVLLVDGDIPKSHITRVLGLEGRPGLMDVLVDEQRPVGEVIVRTDVPNLLVVPVGQRHPLTVELFASQRMQHVLDELGGRNMRRLLVFDSSPLLAASESQVLASHMGQVVFVIAAGVTPQHIVNSALQALGDAQFVGLLLNMSSLPASENHYDSYYGQYSIGHREGA